MKAPILLILSSLLCLFASAQNGGQFFENNVIRVLYAGYSEGSHTFSVCNKQPCEARIRTKADQDPAIDIRVPPNSCLMVSVVRSTPAAILFRVKAETSCPNFTNPDMGWLEINTGLMTLPLDETQYEYIREKKNMSVKIISGRFIKVETGNDIRYNLYIRVVNPSGVEMFSQKRMIHKSAEIDMGYRQRGLVIVRVVIENGISHIFTLKTFLE
jgi:hypothetical protein